MCFVTATELKRNLSYYLKLSETEDVHITKNEKTIAILSNPQVVTTARFLELEGSLKGFDDNRPYKEIIGEEIAKKCGY